MSLFGRLCKRTATARAADAPPITDVLPDSWFINKPSASANEAETPAPSTTDFAISAGLADLVDKVRFRFPKQPEQNDLLPSPEQFDTSLAISRLVAPPAHEPKGNRRLLEDQLLLLQKTFAGRPEILLWHSMAVSYLRRNTSHTDKAKQLFFKIWDEQGTWMASNLNGRWLISALQTFADHGRNGTERQCGSVGFVYGNLIKIYECEIASAYRRTETPLPFRSGSVPGLHKFQPGDDILFNLNTFVIACALDAGPAGIAMSGLMSNIKSASCLFSRTDELASQHGGEYHSFTGKRKGDLSS